MSNKKGSAVPFTYVVVSLTVNFTAKPGGEPGISWTVIQCLVDDHRHTNFTFHLDSMFLFPYFFPNPPP